MATLGAIEASAAAEPQIEFSDLGVVEQRDFMSLVQKVYVLGDPSAATGAFGYQDLLIQRLDENLLKPDLAKSKFNDALILSLVKVQQPLADARFEFRRNIGQDPSLLADYYSQVVRKLPSDLEPTFENVMSRLAFELDQKLFLVRWPELAKHTPFPGLRGYALKKYRLFLSPDIRAPLTDSILQKLDENLELTFDEFKSLMSSNEAKLENCLNAYQDYLSFGWLPSLPPQTSLTKEEYLARVDRAASIVQKIADGSNLTTWTSSILPHEIERNWLLWTSLRNEGLEINQSDEKLADDRLSGPLWTLKNFEHRIPSLRRALEDLPHETKNYRRFQREIDEAIADLSDADTAFAFRSALESLTEGEWIGQSQSEFPYYKLNESFRRLFAARVFPDLAIREAMAILEQRLFDLKEEERIEIFNVIFSDQKSAAANYEAQARLRLEDREGLARFHAELVRAYLSKDETEKPSTELALLDGSVVPRIKPLRDEMALMIQTHKDQIDYGSFPKWLIDDLMVRFYPTTHHLDEERRRYANEWNRRSLIDATIAQMDDLKAQIQSSSDVAKKRELTARLTSMVIDLNSKLAAAPVDPDSDFALMASFLYGLKPKSSSDWIGVSKDIGIGFVFVVVLRFSGIRSLGTFIMTDTGIRFLTANALDDNAGTTEHVDLSKGYSTWIGLWTAQGIQETWNILERLNAPKSAEDRMDAAASLGELTRSTLAFGVGAELSRFSFNANRLRFRQRTRAYEREIRNLRTEIVENQNRIAKLKEALSKWTTDREVLRRAGAESSETAKALDDQIRRTESEISSLSGDGGRTSQTRLGFYTRAILLQAYRAIEFMLPGRDPKGLKADSLSTRFQRRRALGIKQFQNAIADLEAKLARVDRAYFIDEQSKRWWGKRRGFNEALDQFLGHQDKLAKMALEIESLEQAKDLSGATRSLSSAANELAEQTRDFLRLIEQIRPGRSVTRLERPVLQLDDWIQRNLRPSIFRERPVEPLDFSPGKSSERFISEMRISSKDQLQFLREVAERLRGRLPSLADDQRLVIEDSLRQVDSTLSATEASIKRLTSKN